MVTLSCKAGYVSSLWNMESNALPSFLKRVQSSILNRHFFLRSDIWAYIPEGVVNPLFA